MKAAAVLAAFGRRGWPQLLVHTGQHYDELLSDLLFKQLELPTPDINLGVGSGSHAQQTGAVMTAVEELLVERRPSALIVYGDVNSTMAAALAAAKLCIPVAHVEAGLRSFDRSMPEEINRVVTDQVADYLFTPSADGDANLLREGVSPEKIFLVGNVMIDTLIRCLPMADPSQVLRTIQIRPDEPYVLVTLHRPANVDTPETLLRFIAILGELASEVPVIFPMHPRTRARVGRVRQPPGLHLIEPVGYLEFVGLERDARLVITDSGGVQEETTYLGVPCLTVRPNTERPVTITEGTNTLIGADPARLLPSAREQLSAGRRRVKVPQLWDGLAAERIADVLARVMRG
jgi:UDP-N-acetylglucosamine 2-epimerase (non-hydrolysing)